MKDSTIDLSDGRVLAYTDIGESGRPCGLFFRGAPSSRLRVAYLEKRVGGVRPAGDLARAAMIRAVLSAAGSLDG